MATVVEQLRDEVAGLDDAVITERFRALELEARRVEAELAIVAAEVKRRQLYTDDGHRSMAGWLRANANLSNNQIRRRLHLVDVVDKLPGVIDALGRGHIGIAQAEQLAAVAANPRCGDLLAGSIDVLLEQAEQLPYNDAKRCLDRWVMFADLDGAHRQRELDHERRTATVLELDGTVHMLASGGTAVTAAELQAIHRHFVEAEFEADNAERVRLHGASAPASLLPRTDAQRRFDAVVAIFRAAASARSVGKPMDGVLNLVMDERSFDEGLAAVGLAPVSLPTNDEHPTLDWSERRCETIDGTVLLPDDAVRLALHVYIRRIVVNSAGIPIDVGRRRRLFSGVAAEVAHLLGAHCDNPGCTVPTSRCDIDHLAEWVRDGGLTDLHNAGLRCNADNRFKQRAGQRAYRDQRGRPRTQRSDGSWIHPVGQRQLHERALAPPRGEIDQSDDLYDDVYDDIEYMQQLARNRLAALR